MSDWNASDPYSLPSWKHEVLYGVYSFLHLVIIFPPVFIYKQIRHGIPDRRWSIHHAALIQLLRHFNDHSTIRMQRLGMRLFATAKMFFSNYSPQWSESCQGYWVEESHQQVVHGIQQGSVDIILVYLHGGGCCVGTPLLPYPALAKWKQTLHKQHAKHVAIFCFKYDMAPDTRYPNIAQGVVRGVERLRQHLPGVEHVSFCMGGDSAGGHLAMQVSPHLPFYHSLLLISPWIRIRQPKCSLKSNEQYDYLSGALLRTFGNLYLGPLQLSPLPPTENVTDTLVVAGQREILIEDIVSWCCKVEDQGSRIKLVIGQGQVHCYAVQKILCVGAKGLAKEEYVRACDRITQWLMTRCVKV